LQIFGVEFSLDGDTVKPRLEDTTDLKTAFLIMQRFIEERWKRTGQPAELGALLGDIAFLSDGSPADPASFGDWLAAAEAVLHDHAGAIKLEIKPPEPHQ
jgi:hypothetical protein